MKKGVIDRMAFGKVLTDQSKADNAIILKIMEKAEPLFLNADAGVYRFAEASAFQGPRLAQAISTALGHPVREVELVSISHPWDDWPPAFNETVIKRALQAFLEDGLMQLLYYTMRERHFKGLQQVLPVGTISALTLEQLVQDATQKHLWKSLKKNMRESGLWPDDLWRELYRGLHLSLVCYAGYLLAGLPDKAAELEPLIDLLPSAIPIGSKKFSQSTMVVFVA